MVYFKQAKWQRPNKHQEYWKLDTIHDRKIKNVKNIFKKKNFYFPSAAKANKISSLYSRYQLGRPSYAGYDLGDLVGFCQGRGLQQPMQHRSKKELKADLVTVLEKADINMTFNRFTDLPAEIRVRIYSIHFDSFPVLKAPVQPPISQVSHLIRKESLPVFYQECVFFMDVEKLGVSKRNKYNFPRTPITKKQKKEFFHNIPEEHLGMIRLVGIRAYAQLDVIPLEHKVYGFWRLDLHPNSPMGAMFISSESSRKTDGGFEVPINAVIDTTTKLEDFVKGMKARAEGKKLTRADMGSIMKIFDDSCEEQLKRLQMRG
jgi:hypothetical protein